MNKFNNPAIKIAFIISLMIASVIGGFFYFKFTSTSETIEIPFTILEPVIIRQFGLPVDSFNITEGKIKQGISISELLKSYNVNIKIIDKIVNGSDTVFDLKKIKAGKKYMAFSSLDSSKTLQYLVYEHSPAEYLLFNFNDSIVTRQEKDVITKESMASAKIESSLWNAMADNEINVGVAVELSEIFAWTIDFFDLKKNDYFKVIYDEKFVDSISMGLSKIQAICFNHKGKNYYAFPFVQNDRIEYFDENGNSLKKAFLKAPLKFARVSSKFTSSRWHPVLKVYTAHFGVDYAAPVGTPILTIGNGKIISAGPNGGAGNMVKIQHNNSYVTTYMHLSKFENGIKPGKFVKQGEVIGYVGSTGLSTGPHLDFRVFKNNKPLDPLKMDSPPAEPIKKSNKSSFEILKKKLMKQLNKIKV